MRGMTALEPYVIKKGFLQSIFSEQCGTPIERGVARSSIYPLLLLTFSSIHP